VIDVEGENQPWAAAGSNVTLYLTSIDPVHINIGAVLCPLTDIIPLATVFTAQIIVFDIQVPITAGSSVRWHFLRSAQLMNCGQVELFHHSRDVPATISQLIASLDRTSGTVVKQNPRSVIFLIILSKNLTNSRISVLTKGTSAEVQISIRAASVSGSSSAARPIPVESFSSNKDMGRILIRRGGDTIGAGEHRILCIQQAIISSIVRYCSQACRLIHPRPPFCNPVMKH
jgi:elongation factor 1 alpha-like protein